MNCNGFDIATGAGVFKSSPTLQVRFSVGGPNDWEVDVYNPSANSTFTFHTVVQCLNAS